MAADRFLRRLESTGFLIPSLLTGGLWLKGMHPWLPGFRCPLRHLTGLPCPTCFLTRATSAALVGDWPAAVGLHAFGPLVAIALVVWSILALRQRRLVPRHLPAWPHGFPGSGPFPGTPGSVPSGFLQSPSSLGKEGNPLTPRP